MAQKKEKSSERTNRAEEINQWVQEGPYPPPSDDENNTTQTGPSFETKWNALVE
ncbi:hypothetical protein NW755_009113 [Fusarium falciforme]|uniref:Uncharacterized protein n=1 Tax=Fusarium falciforme TaxID=195108 RepID=A0A9W8UXY1_9HYPO|nr:hypothetical protein NW755_009113 [Fusarium falciforme]